MAYYIEIRLNRTNSHGSVVESTSLGWKHININITPLTQSVESQINEQLSELAMNTQIEIETAQVDHQTESERETA